MSQLNLDNYIINNLGDIILEYLPFLELLNHEIPVKLLRKIYYRYHTKPRLVKCCNTGLEDDWRILCKNIIGDDAHHIDKGCCSEDDGIHIFWGNISYHHQISEEFIREFKDEVCWYLISAKQDISENFVIEMEKYIDWDILVGSYPFNSNKIMKACSNQIWVQTGLQTLSFNSRLSIDIIREFQEEIDWEDFTYFNSLTKEFIQEFKHKLDLKQIHRNKTFKFLPLDVIEEIQQDLDWEKISFYPDKLSSDFIRKFNNKLDWDTLSCTTRDLSYDIIQEFHDRFDWNLISKLPMTTNFMRKFRNYIDWDVLIQYRYISEEILREFQNEFELVGK